MIFEFFLFEFIATIKPSSIFAEEYVATRVVRSKGKRPPKKPANTAMDIAFDSLYFKAVREGLKDEEMADYIGYMRINML